MGKKSKKNKQKKSINKLALHMAIEGLADYMGVVSASKLSQPKKNVNAERKAQKPLVISGPRGSGKTTMARIIYKYLHGDDAIFLNAGNIIEKGIKNFNFYNVSSEKLIVIDECANWFDICSIDQEIIKKKIYTPRIYITRELIEWNDEDLSPSFDIYNTFLDCNCNCKNR